MATTETRIIVSARDLASRKFDRMRTRMDAVRKSTANLERTLLRATAAIGTMAVAGRAFKNIVNDIDDYRQTVIGIAATMTDMAKGSDADMRKIYQNNLKYAEQMYQKVQEMSAKFFAGGKELLRAWEILTVKGVTLTSEEDIRNMGIIVDRIKISTRGMAQSKQIAQEIRAILTGQARVTDQIALILKDRIGPEWKKQLQTAKEEGRVLEWVASQFKGMRYATEDVQKTMQSQLTTLKTMLQKLKIAGFSGMYEGTVKSLRSANALLKEHGSQIAAIARSGWQMVTDMIDKIKAGIRWIYQNDFLRNWLKLTISLKAGLAVLSVGMISMATSSAFLARNFKFMALAATAIGAWKWGQNFMKTSKYAEDIASSMLAIPGTLGEAFKNTFTFVKQLASYTANFVMGLFDNVKALGKAALNPIESAKAIWNGKALGMKTGTQIHTDAMRESGLKALQSDKDNYSRFKQIYEDQKALWKEQVRYAKEEGYYYKTPAELLNLDLSMPKVDLSGIPDPFNPGETMLPDSASVGKNAKKQTDEVMKAVKSLHKKINEMKMSSREYSRWTIEQEAADLREKVGNNKEALDLIAEYQRVAVLEMSDDWKAGFRKGIQDISDQIRSGYQMMREITVEAAQAMSGAMGDFFFDVMQRKFESLSDYAQSFLKSIQRTLSDMLAQQVTSSLITAAFGGGGGFGGYRAAGGPVYSGQSYVVGENGPEVLSMGGGGGYITPNHALGGGGSFTVNMINQSGKALEAESTGPRMEGKQMILDVVINAYENNEGNIREVFAQG